MIQNIRNFFIAHKIEISIFFIAVVFSFASFYFNTVKFQNDDQFTIYRYIENIAGGKGFVFNEGERVLGSTTPLFTLLGVLLKLLFPFVSTQLLIALLNTVLISLSAVMFFRLSTVVSLPRWFSLVGVGIFILHMSKTASAGMESPLYILCVLLFLIYIFSGKYALSAVFLGGAVLTRPDALLIVVLAGILWLRTSGIKKTVSYSAVLSAVVFPWIIFATVYFGSPLPQSMVTKSHVADIVYQPRTQAFKVQLSEMSRLYWGKIIDPENIPIQVGLNLLPFLFFTGVGFWYFRKKYWLLFGIPCMYLISFSYSNPVMYPWYISQLTPLWLLCSLLGVYKIFEYILSRANMNYKPWVYVGGVVILLAGPLFGYAELVMPRGEGSKITLYKMALYVKEHKQSGDVVGLSNIGIVSYTLLDTYIYDFIGLTRKDTLQYYPIKDECLVKNQYVIPPQMIRDVQPDWIIAGEAEWVPCFVQGEWFLSRYKAVYNAGTTAHVWQKIK
ncbi:MAG: hypothetical protein RL292_69 [Candidatus Parcubacteria bacterium]|jgi:hypothetical protein